MQLDLTQWYDAAFLNTGDWQCRYSDTLRDASYCIFADQLLDQNIFYKEFARSVWLIILLWSVVCVRAWVSEREREFGEISPGHHILDGHLYKQCDPFTFL